MASTRRVLIVGGYGTFGGRLARLLKEDARLTLLIAGRSLASADAFCRALPARATLVPCAFDRDGDLTAQLAQLKPDIAVDCTGPFQSYGDDTYRLVRACIANGIHYLDLADGSDFVKGIGRFDDEAKARSVYVLSGVSSFPVLTAAVLRRLSAGMSSIDAVTGGIAPSPYAGVGLNVIRAIAGYAGQKVALIRDGKPATGYGLTETLRYTIAPPGRLPLRSTRFSLVDVPDLQVIPRHDPRVRSIWMGAGPVPEILHRMLNGLSLLVRWKLLPSLLPFARSFSWAINHLRWGEHRGGMFVSVAGKDGNDKTVERSWHMIAEGDDGPLIPSMAVATLIGHDLEGRPPSPGARPAVSALELQDYAPLFAGRAIVTGQRESPPPDTPLYRKILGDAWRELPPALQAMHDLRGEKRVAGLADVERGSGLLARLIAGIIGFPAAGRQIPVEVRFKPLAAGEQWTRLFAGRAFRSVQTEGRGRSQHLLSERFGAVTVGLATVIRDGQLHLVVRRWTLFGIPMPLWLAPHGAAFEHAANGVFNFDVEIRHPFCGMIVHYRGWLKEDETA